MNRAWVGIGIVVACSCAGAVGCGGGRGGRSPILPDGAIVTPDGETPDGGEPRCVGRPIVEDGVLDLDLSPDPMTGEPGTWTIRGRVTLDGAPIGIDGAGTVVFEPVESTASSSAVRATVALGDPSYEAMIAGGMYDVWFEGPTDGSACAAAGPIACGAAKIHEAVSLAADGVLDLDVRTARISGQVTVDGAPLASATAGAITLSPAARSGASITVALPRAPSWDARVVASDYAVGWIASIACDGRIAPPSPCNGGTVMESASLRSDGALDLDLPTARLRGALTVDGAPAPATPAWSAALVWSAAGDGDLTEVSVPMSASSSSYDVRLLRGDYDLGWAPDGSSCGGAAPSAVPCNAGVVRGGVSVRSDGVVDADLSTAIVRGRVLVNGSIVPAGDVFGAIALDAGGGASTLLPIASDATFVARVLSGHYDVLWVGDLARCGDTTVLPCNSGAVREIDLVARSDGALDVDLPAGRVRGRVTIDGAAPATGPRGAVVLAQEEDSVALSIAESGEAMFEATLLAATYDVAWGAPEACASRPMGALPCVSGPLGRTVTLAAGGVNALDVDVPAVSLVGRVTLEGATLPDAESDRGALVFENVDGGSVRTLPFAPAGEAEYALTLLPGSYVVSYDPNFALCGGTALPRLPCSPRTIAGCEMRAP